MAEPTLIKHSLSVLIVDEIEGDRMRFVQSLSDIERVREVETSPSLKQALHKISQHYFDVVITDYDLGEGSGIDILNHCADQPSKAAVIVTSREKDNDLAEKCIALGAQDFLVKFEISPERLINATLLAHQRANLAEGLRVAKEENKRALQQKTLFFQRLTDELKSPLFNLKTASETLSELDIANTSDEFHRTTVSIAKNSKDAIEVLNSFMDLDQLENEEESEVYASIDLSRIVQEKAVALQRNAERNRLVFKSDIAPHCQVVSNLPLLEKVIDELLENALTFTATGHIGISLFKTEYNTVAISVEDTGEGLSEEQVKQIYGDVRLNDSTHGSDLNVGRLKFYWMRRALEKLNATLEVRSEKGEGANFTFYFADMC